MMCFPKLALLLGLTTALSVRAQTNHWTNTVSGKWEVATNWSLGVPPAASQVVYLTNAGADLSIFTNFGSKRVTIDALTATSFPNTMTVTNLTVAGAGSNLLNILELDNVGTTPPFHVLNKVSLATGGLLAVTNTSVQVDGLMSVGSPAPNATNDYPATFALTSGSASVGNLSVGAISNALGLVNVSGGTLWVSNALELATVAANSTGLVTVAGGTLVHTNQLMLIGASGEGLFDQIGGTVLSQGAQLGRDAGSQGSLFLYGGTFIALDRLLIGNNTGAGPGSAVIWTNGALYVTNASHTAYLDLAANGQLVLFGGLMQVDNLVSTNGGSFENFAGSLIFAKPLDVENGTTFNVNSGTTIASSDFTLGALAGSTGTLVIQNGGTLDVTQGVLGIGNDGTSTHGLGTGIATVDNATLNVATLTLGSSLGGQGTLEIKNNAIVSLSGNLTVVSGSLAVTSSVSISGGSLIGSNSVVQVGPFGSGQLLISGGNHILRQILLGATNNNGSGVFELSGGSLNLLGKGTGPGAGLDSNFVVIEGGDLDGSGTSITVGDGHSSAMSLSGFGACQFATMYVGYSPGYTGTYTQSGGTMLVYSNLFVGDDCPDGTNGALGVVNLNGGTLYVTNADHTALLDLRNGTFTLNPGATLVVDNLAATNPCGQFVNNGGTLVQSNSQPPPTFRISSIVLTNQTDVRLDWTTIGGQSYVVQTNADLTLGIFHDLSGVILAAGTGPGFTNYVQAGGATNSTSFYRIRQVGGSSSNSVQTTNLLLNPGAETGDLTAWTAAGTIPPTVDNGTIGGLLGIHPHAGSDDFVGGGGDGSLSQVVGLIDNQGLTAAAIDSGQLGANVSFWEQGLNLGTPNHDDAAVMISFLDATSNVLSSVATPELDSHAGSWSNYTSRYLIPTGTRFIQYTLQFIPHATNFFSVFVDDNLLTISSGPVRLEPDIRAAKELLPPTERQGLLWQPSFRQEDL